MDIFQRIVRVMEDDIADDIRRAKCGSQGGGVMGEEERAEAAREWQAIVYGDHPETWAALAYYRDRGWPVDDNTWAARERVMDMIHGFKSGYRAALEMPRPAPPQEDRA